MVDFTKLATTAQRLVSENGRTVTIVQLSKDLDDPTKDWRGKHDPRANPEDSISATAVFVDPASFSSLGFKTDAREEVKRSEQIALVALGSGTVKDLTTFDEVQDGDINWSIIFSEKLQPGSQVLLFTLGLKR